ncbi:hypothetical protein pb186bvf_018484 [Paramecium bursaria]
MIDNKNDLQGDKLIRSFQQPNDAPAAQQEIGFYFNLDNPQEEKINTLEIQQQEINKSHITNEDIKNLESHQCQLTAWIEQIKKIQVSLQKALEYFIEFKEGRCLNCFCQNQKASFLAQDNLSVINSQIEQLISQCDSLQDKQKIFNLNLNKFCSINDDFIGQAQLSPNDKYVAYSVELKYIKLYSLQAQKLEQQIKATNNITQFQFSNNSNLLYIGCQNGQLLIYDIQQQKYITKIHISSQFLNNIIQINDNMALVSCNKSQIRLIHLNDGKKYFNLKAHSTQKQLLAYDSINKTIINCQSDKSIQFYQLQNRRTLFVKQNTHDKSLIQIQFINQVNQLFTLDLGGLLKLWYVSYGQKQLTELKTFTDQSQIYNFTYQQDLQQLMILTQQQIKIMNQKDDQNQVIDHNIKQLKILQGNINSDKSNYMLILANSNIQSYQQNKSIYIRGLKFNQQNYKFFYDFDYLLYYLIMTPQRQSIFQFLIFLHQIFLQQQYILFQHYIRIFHIVKKFTINYLYQQNYKFRMMTLDKNILHVLDDIIQNEQPQKEYNIFLIGTNQSGKSTISDILEKQLKQNYNIYECNNFPKMDVFQGNHIKSMLKYYYQINKCGQSLIIFVFSQSEIIVEQSRKIFDLISKISQGVQEAFIIFNYAESENQIKRFYQKFLTNYDSRKEGLPAHTCLLLDKIIKEDKIIFVKFEQDESEISIKNEIIQQLFEEQNYHQIQIQHIFNDQALDMIKYNIGTLNELINQNQKKIILQHCQNLIKTYFSESLCQQAQSLQEDQQIIEKYQKYLQVFQNLKLFQNQDNLFQINRWDNILQIIEHYDDYISDDTLYIICARFSTKQLQLLYQHYQQKKMNFHQVFIFSLFYFAANEDIKMPGISVYIYTYCFEVLKQIQFDLSGADGFSYMDKAQNGKNDQNKVDDELDGQNGNDGEHGQNGGSFLLNSRIHNNFQKIEFHLRGGSGGKGQDGGDGADGLNGRDALRDQVDQKNYDYICDVEPVGTIGRKIVQNLLTFNSTLMIIFRSEGTLGQKGGNAGCGGFGGYKGEDGIFYISKSFVGSVKYKNQTTVDGENGQSGRPGKGGMNGRDYEGQYEGVFVLGDCRDFGPKKQNCVNQQTVTIVGVVSTGVKLSPKLFSKLVSFFEAQLGAKLALQIFSGGSVLAIQSILSSIQQFANQYNDFTRVGYLDKGKQPNGQTIKLNRKNNSKQQQNLIILKTEREKSNNQFSDFVNEKKLLFSIQIPYLNQFEELFREQ